MCTEAPVRQRHAASRATAHRRLGAVLFVHWRWSGWVAGLVLAVVLVSITALTALTALTGLARFAVRLGSASKGGTQGASKGG